MKNMSEKKTIDAEYTEKEKQPVSSDDHTYGIVAYMTWIGLIVALCSVPAAQRSEYLKFHLNQSLVLWLFGLLGLIPFAGWLWAVAVFVFWLLDVIGACEDQMKKTPLLGNIHILY